MSRSWTRGDGRRWQEALDLVTVPWMSAYLVPLGVPPAVAARVDALIALRSQAAEDEPSWETDEAAVGTSVTRAMSAVAAATSYEAAAEFDRWVRRHFLCRDALAALYTWRQVLARVTAPPGGLYERVPPPAALVALLPAAAERIDRAAQLATAVSAAMPSDEPDTGRGLRLAEHAAEVASNEGTAQTLRVLGTRRSDERMAIVEWAQAQAASLDMNPDELHGESFLDEDPPCEDAPPSVLIPRP
jgi:hypothetical protein